VCTVAAAVIIYKIMRSMDQTVFSASVASLAFGTFPLVWSQAITTEVNALNGLFAAILLYIFIKRISQPLVDVLWGIIAGLGLGNHLIILFMLPLLFVDLAFPVEVSKKDTLGKKSIAANLGIFVRRLAGLCLGLCVYLLLPLRAGAKAPVNWGNAVTLHGLIWLVTGKMYWARLNDFNGNYLMAGVQSWSHFIVEQLGVFGLLAVFIVLAVLFKRSRIYLSTGWLVLIYSLFSVLYYSPDSYVYLIPALISISIWIGLGSGWVVEKITTKNPNFKALAELGFFTFILIHAFLEIPKMDLSGDLTSERYAQVVLNTAPNKAIIFTEGDEATFALWYMHYVYHQRPDVAIISSDLIAQPWYPDVLKYTYPDLILGNKPGVEGIIFDNQKRPVCHAGSDLQTIAICSP
jgi:hypothetical protein